MAKASVLKPGGGTLAALCILSAANYFAVRFWDYPFLYCWTVPWLSPIYLSWGSVTLYAIAAYIVWALATGRMIKGMIAGGIFFSVIELPRLAGYLFRQGGFCG